MDRVMGLAPSSRSCPSQQPCSNCGDVQGGAADRFVSRVLRAKVPPSILQQELYENQELCDVSINVIRHDPTPGGTYSPGSPRGNAILTHRMVLASHSPQLRAIFASSPASPPPTTPNLHYPTVRSLSAESTVSRHHPLTMSHRSTPRLIKTNSAASDGADSGHSPSGFDSATLSDDGICMTRPVMSIDVHDVSVAAVRNVVEFAYTGNLAVSIDKVEELLKASLALGFREVEALVRDYLGKQPPAVVLRMLIAAHLRRVRKSVQSSPVYIEILFGLCEDQFEAVAKCPELLSMPYDLFHALLSSNRLILYSEELVFETCLAWVQHQKSSHHKTPDNLTSLIKLVRLPFVSSEYLTYRVVSTCAHIPGNPFREQIRRAQIHHGLVSPDDSLQLDCSVFHQYAPRVYQPQPAARLVALSLGSATPNDVPGVECLDLSCEGHPLRVKWRTIGRRSIAQQHPTTVANGNKVYVIGGHLRGKSLDTFQCLDVVHGNGKWTSLPAMLARRDSPSAVVFNKDIYTIGGCSSGQTLDLVERYSSRLQRWCLAAPMSMPRAAAGIVANDSMIFAIGGCIGNEALSSVECYDVSENEWYSLPDMATARISPAVAFLNNCLMVFGGHDASSVHSSGEFYDSAARSWRPLPSMQTPRTCASCVIVANKALVYGGHDGFHRLANGAEFCPKGNEWQPSSIPSLAATDSQTALLLIDSSATRETIC